MRESTVETYLKERVEVHNGECLKWTGVRGVPDRLIFMNGVIIPVELKQEKGVVGGHQKRMHQRLWRTGNEVKVIWNKRQVDALVAAIVALGYCECPECISLRMGALN